MVDIAEMKNEVNGIELKVTITLEEYRRLVYELAKLESKYDDACLRGFAARENAAATIQKKDKEIMEKDEEISRLNEKIADMIEEYHNTVGLREQEIESLRGTISLMGGK